MKPALGGSLKAEAKLRQIHLRVLHVGRGVHVGQQGRSIAASAGRAPCGHLRSESSRPRFCFSPRSMASCNESCRTPGTSFAGTLPEYAFCEGIAPAGAGGSAGSAMPPAPGRERRRQWQQRGARRRTAIADRAHRGISFLIAVSFWMTPAAAEDARDSTANHCRSGARRSRPRAPGRLGVPAFRICATSRATTAPTSLAPCRAATNPDSRPRRG